WRCAARTCRLGVRQRRRERRRGLPRLAGRRDVSARAAAAPQPVARGLAALTGARARDRRGGAVGLAAAGRPRARSARARGGPGSYLGGVGLNAAAPARGGDVLKLFLVKRRIEGSTYPTLTATLLVETLFDAVIGLALLVWAIHLGFLPSLGALPRLPNVDWRWLLRHPQVLEIGALLVGIALGALLVWATAHVRAFWRRVAQGFAIVRDPRAYAVRVVTWQALSWLLRFGCIYWMLRAFHVPATLHATLL